MLADDDALSPFFDQRIPDDVVSGKTFEAWRAEAEARDPTVLYLSLADILLDEAHELSPERYPDQLVVHGATLPLAYRFDPGEDDDGITVTVPLALLPQLDPGVLAWTIPGWHAEKIRALLDVAAQGAAQGARPARRARAPSSPPSCGRSTARCCPRSSARSSSAPASACRATRGICARCPPTSTFTFRVVDEHDKVARRRAAISPSSSARSASARRSCGPRAPRERYERTGPQGVGLRRAAGLGHARRRRSHDARVSGARRRRDRRRRAPARVAPPPPPPRRATACAGCSCSQLGTTLAKLEAQLPGSLAQGRSPSPARRCAAAADRAARARRGVPADRSGRRSRAARPRSPSASPRAAPRCPARSPSSARVALELDAELDKVRARAQAARRQARRHARRRSTTSRASSRTSSRPI